MAKQYRTVKLPAKMLEAVDSIIKNSPECGYSSIADFVKDSVRHHYCWFVHKIKFEEE
ncbi:MAG: ribbon-helix-helix domain-containing protein [Candidatus Bathyarchaeia archaeon]